MKPKFSHFVWLVVLMLLTAFMYGAVLPKAVSSEDDIIVVLGLLTSLFWAIMLGRIFYLYVKKVSKNA